MLAVAIMLAPLPAAAQQDADATLTVLRAGDMRLNRVFWRLTTANAVLCHQPVAATGLVLHARSAYRGGWEEAAQAFFGFAGEVAVEAVNPDSPAARSGVRADDTLVAVNGVPLDRDKGPRAVEMAYRQLEDGGRTGQVAVTVLRDGAPQTFQIGTVPACTERIEIRFSGAFNARTDGDVIQVNSAAIDAIDDDGDLAVIVAHELGHFILRHPYRLEAARKAHLRGANSALVMRTEIEADQISPWLMANAGYDPAAAVRVYAAMPSALFGDVTHPPAASRAQAMRVELQRINTAGPVPLTPPILATRDDPLGRR